jgi:hypothetical protein
VTPWAANQVSVTLRSTSGDDSLKFEEKHILFVSDLLQLPPVVSNLSMLVLYPLITRLRYWPSIRKSQFQKPMRAPDPLSVDILSSVSRGDTWYSGLERITETIPCDCHRKDWYCSVFLLFKATASKLFLPLTVSESVLRIHWRIGSVTICKNGEVKKLSYWAPSSLWRNLSNHSPIGPGCLKLSNLSSSRRLILLTCLQTMHTHSKATGSFCSQMLTPDPGWQKAGATVPCTWKTGVFQFDDDEARTLTRIRLMLVEAAHISPLGIRPAWCLVSVDQNMQK